VIDESRTNELHPYFLEALALASKSISNVKVTTNIPLPGRLEGLFRKYGSDKETVHNYEPIYSEILGNRHTPHILEIGLGSKNSSKSPLLPNRYRYAGREGGSIKAWRSAFPNAVIVGADVDASTLKTIHGIGYAYLCDQNSDESLRNFGFEIEKFSPFDLIVDDGLHQPNANLRTLKSMFRFLSPDGVYVIEDVHRTLIDFWKLVSSVIDLELEIRNLSDFRKKSEDNILLLFRHKKLPS
jgi:SAM-dependent methyltransferase